MLGDYFNGKKIAVLLSGGVDSAVALRLLQDRGAAKISAYYLKIWFEDNDAFLGTCPWEEDLDYASSICRQAGLNLEVISLQKEYYDYVVQYTLAELRRGRTPSPDLFCNAYIKFGAFVKKLAHLDTLIASGHYARLSRSASGELELHRSPDKIKDQSYFLARLTRAQLENIVLPLECLDKSAVRSLAQNYQLPNKDRKDSQGICFLGKIRYSDFVRHYLGELRGKIVERETGKELGEHRGYWFHTVGQRQGLGLGNGPWYVQAKDVEKNIIYVSKQFAYKKSENSRTFIVEDINYIADIPGEKELTTKLRHGPELIRCRVQKLTKDSFRVELADHERGIAPGQFAVFYAGTKCLGSGRIAD